MGHTHHTYDEFDSSLTRPLYGYVTEFESGTVPAWVDDPKLHTSEMERLLDIPYDKYDGDIPRSALPNGVSKNTGRGPTTYTVNRETYLELYRDRATEMESHRRTVRFSLSSGNDLYASRRAATVPDEIDERIAAIRDTSHWNRKVDGYHVNFTKWELVYDIGPRGGIEDVHIMADLNH